MKTYKETKELVIQDLFNKLEKKNRKIAKLKTRLAGILDDLMLI